MASSREVSVGSLIECPAAQPATAYPASLP
jgi:hypothetical protein